MPLLKVNQDRSVNGVPFIDITFPDGHKDSLVLQRFYPSEQAKHERTLACNFIGHLEKDRSACVAVTGCPGQDDLEFTINSKHSGPSNMYILHKEGHLELVESVFKVAF